MEQVDPTPRLPAVPHGETWLLYLPSDVRCSRTHRCRCSPQLSLQCRLQDGAQIQVNQLEDGPSLRLTSADGARKALRDA